MLPGTKSTTIKERRDAYALPALIALVGVATVVDASLALAQHDDRRPLAALCGVLLMLNIVLVVLWATRSLERGRAEP